MSWRGGGGVVIPRPLSGLIPGEVDALSHRITLTGVERTPDMESGMIPVRLYSGLV